ncbi:hypothetical protein BO82DRAFT_21630 [Aspergillus uvarum CBS 121591]|uniref:Secreted protein n=1 Tax=Aspergillus uvarum CBS 121591 TaxID=1448315 RepID=A0A319BT27_9EURO|nr:hypothetical protein BO82DRAFT_21630 [Aspergillus uvarum CBS 121591]PYH75497.1 hypothetical protein BO82DRAFT_21630 [Aspergillus uvarum CBS 121591]
MLACHYLTSIMLTALPVSTTGLQGWSGHGIQSTGVVGYQELDGSTTFSLPVPWLAYPTWVRAVESRLSNSLFIFFPVVSQSCGWLNMFTGRYCLCHLIAGRC